MNDIMYYSELAEEYYEATCPKFAINGYEKNVLNGCIKDGCSSIIQNLRTSVDFRNAPKFPVYLDISITFPLS